MNHIRRINEKLLAMRQAALPALPVARSASLGVDHTYCLNLDRRHDRWAAASKRLAAVGIEAERWPAVDGRDPEIAEQYASDPRIRKPAIRSAGALGCLLSHRAIIRDAKRRGYRRIAVFEDDVRFHCHFWQLWQQAALPDDWRLVYLGCNQFEWDGIESAGGVYRGRRSLGTWAMLIDQSLYEPILAALEGRDWPVDNYLAEAIQAEYPGCYVLSPNLCIAPPDDSDIAAPLDVDAWTKRMRWDLPLYPSGNALEGVTLCITAFDRPDHLASLLTSIEQRYPGAKIIVADNGFTDSIEERPNIRRLRLTPDVGASAARNALAAAVDTPHMVLLEEDFIFTDETRLERFGEVLDRDKSLGVIGGSLYANGNLHDYAACFHRHGDQLDVLPTTGRYRFAGTLPYRYCDMVFDFFMCRTEVMQRCPWRDELKIGGEHAAWFLDLKAQGQWRVGHTRHVAAIHDMTGRDEHYRRHRRRSDQYFEAFKKLYGIKTFSRDRSLDWRRQRASDKPNVLVFGIGHSGTTVLTQMLLKLGWMCPGADYEYAESVGFRAINERALRGGAIAGEGRHLLERLPEPWVLKDPRLVVTLPHWLPLLAELHTPPSLLLVTKDTAAVKASSRARGELVKGQPGQWGHSIEQLEAICAERFKLWPWTKATISFEQLTAAASLANPDRLLASALMPGWPG